MASDYLLERVAEYEADLKENGITRDNTKYFMLAAEYAFNKDKDREYGIMLTSKVKGMIDEHLVMQDTLPIFELDRFLKDNKTTYEWVDWYWKMILLEAQNRVVDSYFLYLERNRDADKQFYLPRRRQFMKFGLIQALQDMIDDKLDLLCISLIPGGGKTTLEKMFHSAVIGWYPEEYNLFFSHSSAITRMYYDGVLSFLQDSEYCWGEIFPLLKVTSTNAKLEQINVGEYKPFPNLQTASVGSEMAGKVRASKFLFVDDMIGKIEEALNKNTLDKLWNIYTTDARQRMVTGCKEIVIATRWSVNDIIGRLMLAYEGNERCKFISVPDIDPETGESNFDYDYNGFTVEFFKSQEMLMDNITYQCLYKNEPIEREGLLYTNDELRRYTELPSGEPDAIIGICDSKTVGVDYMFLPCFYQYGNDFYLVDCVCDNTTDFSIQHEKICDLIIRNKMQRVEFESNAGGIRLAGDIDRLLKEKGYTGCSITTKPTESNKETRIIVNAEWVKQHCLFKMPDTFPKKSDYGIMMDFLVTYSVMGKNKFDDVVDGLSLFVLFVANLYKTRPQAQVIKGGLFR